MTQIKTTYLAAHADMRGKLVKTHTASDALKLADFKEEYYTISKKRVLRGLHKQDGQRKLLICLKGSITIITVDKDGNATETELNEDSHASVLIPAGVASGYLAHEKDTIVLCKTDTKYLPEQNTCVNAEGLFSFDAKKTIRSPKDKEAPKIVKARPCDCEECVGNIDEAKRTDR